MANYFITGCKQLGHEIFAVKDGRVTFDTDEDTLRKLWENYYVPMVQGHLAPWEISLRRCEDRRFDRPGRLDLRRSLFPTQVTINDTKLSD